MSAPAGARVLLIGGAGFIGSHVARELLAAGHHVTAMSRRGTIPTPGADAITADRTDPESLAQALEGQRFDFTVDFVAFEAADVERLLLIPYAALGRYVLISTGQTYLVTEGAQPPYREEDSDHPLRPEPDPDSDAYPNWKYGVDKRRAESALLALRTSYGMRATILRLPILQGEGDGSLRLWAYLERMLDGGPLLLPDGGVNRTRHLYVGDVARAIVQLLGARPTREAIYNLAQPDLVSVRELIEAIARSAGFTPQLVDASWDEMRAAGLNKDCSPYASPWSSILDASRAAAEWAFAPRRLDEYLPQVVRWHLEHRPAASHIGYAQRAIELELAGKRAAARA